MSKTAYNISLKGKVGGNFDRATVDSLGGSLATGLSISDAFRNHGNINVDFVGLNASDDTVSSHAHISCLESIGSMFNYCSVHATLF